MRAPATLALIAINVAVFIWQFFSGDLSDNIDVLVSHGALVGLLVMQGEWWRIVSGAFEHANLLHIAFNMFALYQVGTFVEIVSGRWRMLALYFISLLGSGLAVTYMSPNTATLGASGAIFGLFGALVAIGIRLGKDGRSLIGQTLPIIGINLVLTFTVPNISQAAHIGGLISGFFSGLILFAMQRRGAVAREEVTAGALAQDSGAVLAGHAPEGEFEHGHEHEPAGEEAGGAEEGSR
jgi:rhomboid protease GluP